MKFTWLSNSPWSPTGYGNQTKLFLPRFQKLGHEPAVIAFYGLEGGLLAMNGVVMFPKGRHPYGQDVAAAHTRGYGAKVLFSLIDTWVYNAGQMQEGGIKWIPWFPVDMEPLARPVMQAVAPAYRRIVFSKFGKKMVEDAGLDCYYVPHGVDTKMLRPMDRVQARKTAQLPDDKFIVGMVAANKGLPPRKAFFENIAAFAALHKAHPDTLLYLHTATGDHPEGTQMANLPEYCETIGLEVGKDVLFPNQYQLMIGFPDEAMTAIYNSMDVHLLVSMGEGFGIPIVEAQACGTPVIVGDWTAMGELCFSGWKVSKKDATPYWTPLAAWQYTPHVGAIADKLDMAYRMSGNMDYRNRARDGALAYDADKVAEKYWKPVLEDIEQSLERRAVKL